MRLRQSDRSVERFRAANRQKATEATPTVRHEKHPHRTAGNGGHSEPENPFFVRWVACGESALRTFHRGLK